MNISIELPLDRDGYIRRQCPRCELELKWLSDHKQVRSSQMDGLLEYYCPYCGEKSAEDKWWTVAQVDYMQAMASTAGSRIVEQLLDPSRGKLNRNSGLIRINMEVPTLLPPAPLFESNDMIAVEPPCHPSDCFKVEESWHGELHCCVCGTTFIVFPS